jgi:plasmid stabilization system protein ParE
MTRYKVIYSAHALTDLEDAVYYYNQQQKGLGKRFAPQVQLALASIKKNPHFASFRYSAVPRCRSSPTWSTTPSTKPPAPSWSPPSTAPGKNHSGNNRSSSLHNKKGLPMKP